MGEDDGTNAYAAIAGATVESALSVAEVTDRIRGAINDDPVLGSLWIEGEISSTHDHRSGLFFTVMDAESRDALEGVIWSRLLPRLATVPKAGDRVFLCGRLEVYSPRSQYKLMTEQVLPAGAGLEALRLQQLRDRLLAEGLFDEARKRPLPTHPRTIAVVTSAQAAAWGDIQRTLGQRYPGLAVLLSPATVQGDRAPTQIVAALERVVGDGRAEAIVLARGGGASEDLSCFNDERLVRAIAACPVPVVTGIGHERDHTLADEAADLYAHTPTAAAERVVPALAELREQHGRLAGQARAAVVGRLRDRQRTLEGLQRRIDLVHPRQALERQRQRHGDLQRRAIAAWAMQRSRAKNDRDRLYGQLAALDPTAVLRRGYAIARNDRDDIVRDAAATTPGDRLRVQLSQGAIVVRVEGPSPEPPSPPPG